MTSSLSQSNDVFLSFRGEDTRTGFISHLYDALTKKHIRTFKDDKSLEIGNCIAPELLEAIEASRFAVVVLSRGFATSKWCLEEIAKIVDCMERGKLIVIPVFYHVEPSDVRHQRDCFEQGFANHEQNPDITSQKVNTWREAFEKVGAIKGLHITSHRNESEIISEIVRKLVKDLQVTLLEDFTDGLVGIDSRVHEMKRILSMEPDKVRFVGICGMSGMGKTTLAEVVYKGIQNQFQGSCFIENIKNVSKNNDCTSLYTLQKKLLDDILKDNIQVRSVTHGQTLLQTMLHRLKVIIVLDDVNHEDQLTYLAGKRGWFGPGSRIIVTTTNNYLMAPDIVDEIYTCEEMKRDEALRLFYLSAFKKEHPTHGYEKLADDLVKLAGGLPLALKVYGRLLYGQEENYWKGLLKKLRKYPHEEVFGRLETVYARLDRHQKNTFVYIACFLRGRNIQLVKDILTDLGLQPESEIPDLQKKFLISINHDNSVWVHDLLQQMCWEVLHKESKRHDGKLIAIKFRQDVEDILSTEPEETRTIDIINQEPYKVGGADFYDEHNCFSKMRKLKFLRISKIACHQGLHCLSNDLRILEWYGCSLKSFPSMFGPKHIFELEMCFSQLETLWEKDLDLPNLRSINLSFSKDLTKIPDLTATRNLEKLSLEGCTNLTELHESILLQKKVRYLNLKGCTRLRNLGRRTMEMEALEALHLSGCSNLEYLPTFGEKMKRLQHLYVDRTSITKLPDNLGEMCELRNINASGTSIDELPSSIYHMTRLRLLHVHRCRILSKAGGFHYTNLKTLSTGLRELDLSYCNLSVVPDGIGLLVCIIKLDLSGNDFVSLPADISLLSKLRMLLLNNCMMLQSLPKLSLEDEDMDYGPRSRFKYYVSVEGIDVSKFHASGSNNTPTVSCLNCPKLAEEESGSYLAEKILNNYLKLRSKYWITPQAVFEIVGAGRKIPSMFKLLTSNESIILKGPWIGVAICAVITVDHIDTCMDAKYVVTVHIHVGQKHWKIPISINYFVEGLDNQVVLYWTVADDFQKTIDSDKKECRFSFDMPSGDGNLQLIQFGVHFIRDEDIQQMKQLEDSTSQVLKILFRATLFVPSDVQWYIRACEADMDLHTSHLNIQDLPSSIIKFILDFGNEQNSLNGIHKIMKCLIELNQQVFNECKEDWMHKMFFPLVYDYYRISHGISELYTDFVRLLNDISGTWFSVKFALEQIVAKLRASVYTHKEMLQQLNDLEAPQSVRFSDNFLIMMAYMSKQTFAFFRHLNKQAQGSKNFKSLKILAKVSSIIIAGFFTMVATYVGDNRLLRELKKITSDSMWFYLIQCFTRKGNKWLFHRRFHMYASCKRELRILDFYSSSNLLKNFKNKMARFNCVSDETEEEMLSIIEKLEKKINSFSVTIDNMRSHAQKYSLDTREVGSTLNPFIAKSNVRLTKFGVWFVRDEDIQQLKVYVDSMREAISNLYEATTFSLHVELPWVVCACGADNYLIHSCHSVINDHTCSIIKSYLDYTTQQDSLDGICKIFECIHEVHQKTITVISGEWRERWRYFITQTFTFFKELASLLKNVNDSMLSVKLALEQILEKGRENNYPYVEMLQQLYDISANRDDTHSHDQFEKSAASIRKIASNFSDYTKYIEKTNSAEEVARVLIAGVLSVLITFAGDYSLMEKLSDIPTYDDLHFLFRHLPNRRFIKRNLYGKKFKIWDFNGNEIVGDLKKKMGLYDCFTKEIEEEIVISIEKLETKINGTTETITDMYIDACKYHDAYKEEFVCRVQISDSDSSS